MEGGGRGRLLLSAPGLAGCACKGGWAGLGWGLLLFFLLTRGVAKHALARSNSGCLLHAARCWVEYPATLASSTLDKLLNIRGYPRLRRGPALFPFTPTSFFPEDVGMYESELVYV
jgi:hypothetical protein